MTETGPEIVARLLEQGFLVRSETLLTPGIGFSAWRDSCRKLLRNGKSYVDEPLVIRWVSDEFWAEVQKQGRFDPRTGLTEITNPNLLDVRERKGLLVQFKQPSEIALKISYTTNDFTLPLNDLVRTFVWSETAGDFIFCTDPVSSSKNK